MEVSIVKQDGKGDSLRKAIDLCDGFKDLKKDQKILIKPNYVSGASPRHNPPFGFVTTTAILEELIQLLIEKGCKDITIGEGSIVLKDMRSSTATSFKFFNTRRLAKKYGVKLMDFEQVTYE